MRDNGLMNTSTLPRRTELAPVTVLLVAAPYRLQDLGRHLSPGWLVVRPSQAEGAGTEPDIVVLDDADPRAVTGVCLRYPAAGLVALLSPSSDHNRVVEVLNAGADACVRSDDTAILAAHVEACHRRQEYAA